MHKQRLVIMDMNSGEIIAEAKENQNIAIVDNDRNKVIKQSIEKRNVRNSFIIEHGNFIFKHNKIQNEITGSDEVRLAFISTFVDYDGILRQDSGVLLNKTKLFKLIGSSREIFDDWYDKIIDSEIIIEQGEFLILDKNFYTKGSIKIKNNSHTRLFINAMRNLYESNQGKNLMTLGHVFKILPYINLHNGIICWRPNNKDNYIPMTAREMLELINIDTSNILRTLRMLAKHKIDNNPLFSFYTDHIDYGNDKIMVNPRLFYNGNMKDYERILCEYDKTLELSSVANAQ